MFVLGALIIEFAEEFSKVEKVKRVILYVLLGAFIVISHQKWLLPYISWYANTAYCHTPFGYSGVTVLWYGLFVGLPIFCAILVAAYSVPNGIKGLRDGQFPPKGVKVYKPTKIIRGRPSKVKSLGHLIAPLLFVVIGIWGSFQVENLPNDPDSFDYSVCESE
ncbi:hypothetical protein [Rheinheimera sp. MMS21-TC3]|uniref:hypothetical protein n=1 Tax=Rheinheimera sp. MMS21-TC3 TaxID=3072790 RepID=UPI0028C3DBED|nr:hypothetical protein [Rheinheimera sp. MMS21-TC3]WNO60206.1 hypothetical protein RDV63_04385 [Rheinheimera sp. MMS21-TC3]